MESAKVFFRELWVALRGNRSGAVLGAIGNVIFLLGHLATPVLIGRIIQLALPGASRSDLWENVWLWVAVILVSLVGEWMVGFSAASVTSRYGYTMRMKAIASVHASPFRERNAGDLTTRMTSDLDIVEQSMMDFIVSGFTDAGRLLMVTVVLLLMNPILGLCVLVALLAYFIILGVTAKTVDSSNSARQESMDQLVSKADETLRTVPVIDAYKVSEWDTNRFGIRSMATRRATRKRVLVGWMGNFVGVVTAHVALLVILVIAAISAQDGSMSVAQVAACVIYITGAIESIVLLSPAIPNYQRAGLSALRVHEVCDGDDVSPLSVAGVSKASDEQGAEVVIRSATVVVANNKTILDDVSTVIAPGEWVTVVGPSGSGKSTVLGLITGRVKLTSGEVTVGALPVESVGPLVATSIVFQDSLLFTASIADNIRVGNLQASDAQVEESARLAELHDAIVAMPDGYETVIDGSGRTMSGGQRQRLALARALVRDPKLLILDEATSALDPETAAAVWRSLRRVAKQRGITVVAVCHQLELAADSDRLLVVEAGRVVAEGSPSELASDAGPWRTLFDAHNRVIAGDTEAIMRLLKTNSHLVPRDEATLIDLARRSRIKEAELGSQVCRRGEPMDVFILIASGRLEVSDEKSKFVLGPGSALGGFAELVSGTVDMDAKMVTSGQLVMVPRAAMLPSLLDLMDEEPALAAAIAWLAREGSATEHDLAERIGPGGVAMVELMVTGKRLIRDEDGRVKMVFGSRRRGQFDLTSLIESEK